MNIIAEITDKKFGIEEMPFNNPKVRYGARRFRIRNYS